ncbi:Cell division control protein 2 like protein [Tritrichomonas foetus]|uniref:cyclin-dependent kinase n=1 Tax=Tritrichomonas foetus TaxID=1144522 RepID=A0A1J4KJB9_9EUKA|nr:Cell division control protein 2 like protein [Tritrichomonas foetus]|eukprot:OHT09782.1 Cell division control protein 2 like protein [Tritrichomonas foetus]
MNSPLSRYEKLEKLGEGTYGIVYKARDTTNNELVAMKVMRLEQEEEGVSSTTLRELTILRIIKHCNVVKMINLSLKENSLTLIFEHLDFDLRKLLAHTKGPLKTNLQRSYGFQLLAGLYFLHTHRVIHRDIKPDNLLLDKEGHLKIGDFGLARFFTVPIRTFTDGVVTLWYRPPEVLLHNDFYELSVDIWSAGCVMAEMARGTPLFRGDSEIDMVHKIFQIFGTPTQETIECFHDLRNNKINYFSYEPKNLADLVQSDDIWFVDLLSKMLCLDPANRITAKEALQHPYFNEIPLSVRECCLTNYDLC